MSLPLEDVRVFELSNVLAGPFCGYNLARMGAEVVKIENPRGGDLARQLGADPTLAERLFGASFVAVNACKQSVALDLKSAEGKTAFLRMIGEADVLVESFRPKVMDRLGLGYEVLAARNVRLIYCAVSGFGQNGPWADRPAYDQIVQGLSGAMSVTGDRSSAPLRTGFPVADTIAGLTGAFAIAAALVEQRTTGRGRFIDVSMLESMLACMGWVVSNHLNAGVMPEPMGNQNFTAAPSGTFKTRRGLLNISANEQKQFETLCDLVGRPHLKTDIRYADRQARKMHRESLSEELNEALASRPAEEWEVLFAEASVPAGRVLSVDEALATDQLKGRGFVEELPYAEAAGRTLRMTRPGFLLDGALGGPSPPPALGAQTRRWLERVGYGSAEIERLLAHGIAREADKTTWRE